MARRSLVTKIVLSICGLLGLLLLAGSLVLIAFEARMLRSVTDEHREKIITSINEREQAERETLQKNLQFHARILSEISAVQLYDVNTDGMRQNLHSYLNYPEIVAIAIIDKYGDPFAAAWTAPLPDNRIHVADALPGDLNIADSLVIRVDALLDGEKKGECLLYYTEALLQEKIAVIREQVGQEADEFKTRTSAGFQNAFISQGVALAVILVILIAALVILLRVQVIQPVKLLSALAHKLRDLDLTAHTETRRADEIGALIRAIDEMASSFRQLIGQVQRSGIQVSSSSAELSATAKQHEVAIKNQVQSIHTASTTVQEISDVIAELVQTMQHVALMSQETAGFANEGQTDLVQMKAVMDHMEQASKAISDKLEVIHEKADSITHVMITITKVADQTNLLSLNAAIEAEKAGESGRGFAVVAREIRRLADQTAVATLDIGQTVQEMRSAVSSGVMEMDKFMAEVRHSTEVVAKIGIQLSRIITQVQSLSPNFDGVNQAIEHQSDNVRKIRHIIVSLHSEMEENAASLHESFMAIEDLNDATRNLQGEVSRFIVS